MKVLNIIRSKADDNADFFIEKMSDNNEAKVVELSEDINWDELVDDIFNSDKVTCWW